MKIAVASGKGGTGKTTIALALAQCWGPKVCLVDCDVEEPNCHLFLQQTVEESFPVMVSIPKFLDHNCLGCGKCVAACRFHALARLGKRILVFPELCHSCGGCLLACPTQALEECPHEIGKIEIRQDKAFTLISGEMKVGHSMAPPVIRQLKEKTTNEPLVIYDSPPGTACSMVTTVRGCDYVVLVTEPTPFGLHDLNLAVLTLKMLQIPCGVILNRATETDDSLIETYCQEKGLDLLLKIPYSCQVAEGYSRGLPLLTILPELRAKIMQLRLKIGASL